MNLKDSQNMDVYTFGQPMVGCATFIDAFVRKQAGKLYRVTNPLDFGPNFPWKDSYFHTGDWHRIITNSDGEAFEIEYVESSKKDQIVTAKEKKLSQEEEWAAIMEKLEEIKWVDGSGPDDEIEPIYGDLSNLTLVKKLKDHYIKTYIHNLEKIIATVPRLS